MPRLRMVAVDVVVSHAPAASYHARAARETGFVAGLMERRKRAKFAKDVPSHAELHFVPFAVESCGYMGKAALEFVGKLGCRRGRGPHLQIRVRAVGDAGRVCGPSKG